MTRPRPVRRRGAVALVGATIAATIAAAIAVATPGIGAAAAAAPSAAYVALGDSYTSGPLVLPVAAGAPLDCFQSERNYPHLVAAATGLALRDVSCSGATTGDFTTAQHRDQPPQFDALGPATRLVTVGIGGNDNGLFVDALVTCSAIDALDPFDVGSPCEAVEGSTYTDDIRADAPALGAAFARIHTLAPAARIFVVGYPDILPRHGNCYSEIPLTSGDVTYLDGVETTLDATLAEQAAAHGATFVDTYTPSIGHDLCQPEATRWVEPPIPSTDAFPVHPNAKGQAADATDVEKALQAAGLG